MSSKKVRFIINIDEEMHFYSFNLSFDSDILNVFGESYWDKQKGPPYCL